MTEEGTGWQKAAGEQTPEEAWREVGRQFETLGESLSRAFRAAWESEQTQQHIRSMQDGLERMVESIEHAFSEARKSPEGEKLRTEAERAARSLRSAGEQTWDEARPQLLAALKKINAELERFSEDLEEGPKTGSGAQRGMSSEDEEGEYEPQA